MVADPTTQSAGRRGKVKLVRARADGERIAKALARAGVASRREAERLIAAGRVALNGEMLTTPAVKVGPSDIRDPRRPPCRRAEPTRLWRYHKPAGPGDHPQDPKGRPTVFEALPPGLPRVISVGRLDLYSEGLLLLTNDGALARGWSCRPPGWLRRYRARARGRATGEARRAEERDHRRGRPLWPDRGATEGERDGAANQWITLSLAEGKNREVRKVLEALGLTVNRLIRVPYGPSNWGACSEARF